jgi:hypothetical protein
VSGLVRMGSLLLALSGTFVCAQTPPAPDNSFTADYPSDRAGILLQSSSWEPIAGEMPLKTRAAHGIAASLSYGVVPAKIVAEYGGEHATAQAADGQPVLCICHMIAIPGDPIIVRLHPKKGARELDGGRMTVYPVVGNSKMADANKTDLIPVDVSHPESIVWLVRPAVTLPPGEYALMLGTKNVYIYPFAVTPSPAQASGHR